MGRTRRVVEHVIDLAAAPILTIKQAVNLGPVFRDHFAVTGMTTFNVYRASDVKRLVKLDEAVSTNTVRSG